MGHPVAMLQKHHTYGQPMLPAVTNKRQIGVAYEARGRVISEYPEKWAS